MVKIQYPVPKTLQDCVQGSQTHSGSTVNHQKFEGKANYKLWIQHSGPKRAKTLQDCVQGSQTQSGLTVNHQNIKEKATPSKKSIANYKLALGVLFHSETDPETNEDETANSTDLAHLPMVESDIETIIPNLAPILASETIVYYPEVTRVYCKSDMWDKTSSTKVGSVLAKAFQFFVLTNCFPLTKPAAALKSPS